ncbi:NADH:flavin oxidoreductase/NADH oxidase [Alcaligenaceae bacterium]|nr:NADH:flavin oxidoreductase/NADH oxidase [Alcaligenaceae bacterium]
MQISSSLFSSYSLRDVTFPNRIVVAPMQMYRARQDGKLTDWHFQHYAKWASGGFGTIMTEALMVDPVGRNTYGDLGIWDDAHIEPLRRLADYLHEQGRVAAAQLHHAGPKASRQRPWEGLGPLGEAEAARGERGWQPVSSVSARTIDGWNLPRELSQDEIKGLVRKYGQAARRVHQAGFDVLDIHAAHGYLLHSFLSPIANTRDDAYGGDIHGRMRFLLEVVEAVRSEWPAGKPLFVRISCVDRRKDIDTEQDGWVIEDSIVLARELAARGVDLIDCSSGGIRAENSGMDYVKKRQPVRKGHQVPYAEAIRSQTGIPTMAVGAIIDGPQAERIIASGQADLVAIGRQALRDPHWALNAAHSLGVDPDWSLWPPSYGWWLALREKIGVVD